MCGRYALYSPMEDVAVQFQAELRDGFRPRYNLAPASAVPVVTGDRAIVLHRWGLVPSWAKDPARGMANARAESAADKPSFRGPFRRGRCIIPADAFFEWQVRPGRARQPYCFRAADGSLLAFAGLRSRWEGPEGALDTCAILTTAANALMAPVHDRMPALLGPADWAAWLDPGAAPGRLQALLRPAPEGFLAAHPVGLAVGDARNEGPGLLEPADA